MVAGKCNNLSKTRAPKHLVDRDRGCPNTVGR